MKNHYSLYTVQATVLSHVGTLGVIGRRCCRAVGAGLFGVVEAVVVLVGARVGVGHAAGQHAAAQKGEDGPDPARVQGEAERHQPLLMVRTDGEPDGGHQPARTDYERDDSSDDRALVLGALGFVAEVDAGHGHEQQSHRGQSQDGARDHEGAGRLDVSWQVEYLRKRDAVVQSCGDDAVCPRPLGAQLVHLLTGVEPVLAVDHPVVGGCGDHNAQPAQDTQEKTAQLEAGVRHDAKSNGANNNNKKVCRKQDTF